MSYIKAKDGTSIFFKDWGSGQPVVFCHGWPLSADAWDSQMLFLAQNGFRVIAHDRRGHGRSGQPGGGHDMNTYADDLATLIEILGLKDFMLVGHSAGGGEVTRYLGRHGTKQVKKFVSIAATTPALAKSDSNPNGAPIEMFDGLRAGLAANRGEFFSNISSPFFGHNREGAKNVDVAKQWFISQGLQGAINAQYEAIKAFSETNFTEDLKKIDIPTLFLHGEDDQIVPLALSSAVATTLVKGSTLKAYPGASHGLCTTSASEVNADLLTFFNA